MKYFSLTIFVIIILIPRGLFVTNIVLAAAALTGYMGVVDCDAITGWACDKNDGRAVSAWIYDGPMAAGNPILAGSQSNLDLGTGAAAYCGTDYHWFRIAVPDSLKDGKTHAVHTYASSNDGSAYQLLGNSPTNIRCGASACAPDCSGKNCGSDGCGGSCGACPAGQICNANGACGGKAGDAVPPKLSGLAPEGVIYNRALALTVTTDEPADCRFDRQDKSYETMAAKFNSSDRLYHSAPLVLANYGSFSYFVRCVDANGNTGPAPSRISFSYISAVEKTPPPAVPKDMIAPVISDPEPFGELAMSTVTISVSTDERANCKYDIADTGYASMENKMDRSADAKSHHKAITLTSSGSYTYYVRCLDGSGNQDTQSTQISFTYSLPGLRSRDIQPFTRWHGLPGRRGVIRPQR